MPSRIFAGLEAQLHGIIDEYMPECSEHKISGPGFSVFKSDMSICQHIAGTKDLLLENSKVNMEVSCSYTKLYQNPTVG